MRVKVRKELDLDKPINLRRLSPRMKIYAGFLSKLRETKIYKTNLAKRLDAEYLAQAQRDDGLKEALLVIFYRELTSNASLQSKGLVCDKIIVSVKEDYRDSLERILGHKDFLPYSISVVEENGDLRKAFSNMPILLSVKKKVI